MDRTRLYAGETTPRQGAATPVVVAEAVESQPQESPDHITPKSNGFALAIGSMVRISKPPNEI
jgi:hypothetical protein